MKDIQPSAVYGVFAPVCKIMGQLSSAVQKNISSLQITPLIQISAADFGVKKLIRNPQTPVNMIHDVISYLLNQATWIVLPLITLEFTYKLWGFLTLKF